MSSTRKTTLQGQALKSYPQPLPKLTVIIPVYNEERTVIRLLTKLLKSPIPARLQLLIINDGSTDQTETEITKFLSTSSLRNKYLGKSSLTLLSHPQNLGKGTAIQTGLKHATGRFTLIQDADLEYDPRDIKKLLSLAATHPHAAIYGSRLLTNPFPKNGYLQTLLGNHAITTLTNFLCHTRLTDSYTCYKLISTKVFKGLNLSSSHFEIEAEITAKLARNKTPIIELPINYHPRTYRNGKKIKARDFFRAVSTLFKYALFDKPKLP